MAKSKKLKIYGGCLDGTRRLIVGAYTKAEAAKLMGTNLRYFNMYVSETGNDNEINLCTQNPLTVFYRKATAYQDPYIKKE